MGTPTAQTYRLIGKMKHTFGKTVGHNGLEVIVGHASKWLVDKTSYLTALTIADGAAVSAVGGSSVAMTVDGVSTPLRAGSYKGAIILTVSKS